MCEPIAEPLSRVGYSDHPPVADAHGSGRRGIGPARITSLSFPGALTITIANPTDAVTDLIPACAHSRAGSRRPSRREHW